jgi:integrase
MTKTKTVKTKIGMNSLKALDPNQEILDTVLIGFRARRQSGPAIVFALVYRRRSDGQQRRVTIGRWGALTPDDARQEAKRLAGLVALGGDPAGDRRTERDALTCNELFAEYLAAAKAGRILGRRGTSKKAITQYQDANAIRAHLAPLIGDRKVRDVTRSDVGATMHAIASGATARSFKGKPRGVSRIAGGKGAATRTVGLLGSIFSFAVSRGLRDDNPVSRIRKFAGVQRDRRLSNEEFAALATGLKRAFENETWPPAVNALRFLALTGWRSGEALGLRWSHVDLVTRTARLDDTKTGKSMRPLSHAACDLLRSLPRTGDNDFVFPASRGAGPMGGFKRHVRKIIADAGLPRDVTPNVLRHTFASVAAELGLSDPTIASLVGHRGRTITSRYVHFADAVLLQAADQVANRIVELMREASASGTVVELRRTVNLLT